MMRCVCENHEDSGGLKRPKCAENLRESKREKERDERKVETHPTGMAEAQTKKERNGRWCSEQWTGDAECVRIM